MGERTMLLDDLLSKFSDGDERGWQAEFDWLDSHHTSRVDRLASSIQQDGMRQPILLGDDGRVWDGHHRLCAASHLGLAEVPVVHAADLADELMDGMLR